MSNLNGQGGVLPLSDWARADRAIAEAWGLHKALERASGDSSLAHVRSAILQFSKEVSALSALLERLKHGPVNVANDSQSTRAWTERVNALPKWASEINATADFGSWSGAVKFVAFESAKDAGAIAVKVGEGAIAALKFAPWAAILIVGAVLWSRLRK